MRSGNLAQLAEFAKRLTDDAIAEAGVLPTHQARVAHLQDAGYTVSCELENVLFRAKVVGEDGALMAHGMSNTAQDALLHAILGYCREEHARREGR